MASTLCSKDVTVVFQRCGSCVPNMWQLCSKEATVVFQRCEFWCRNAWRQKDMNFFHKKNHDISLLHSSSYGISFKMIGLPYICNPYRSIWTETNFPICSTKEILPFVLNTKRPLSKKQFWVFSKKFRISFFSKNTQNCFARNSVTKNCSEAVLYSKRRQDILFYCI